MQKTTVNFKNTVDKAIGNYAQDREHTDVDQATLNELKSLRRALPPQRLLPQLLPNSPINSNRMTDYIREAKLRINVIGSQSSILANEINSASTDFWSTLDRVQQEVKSIDSDIQEQEIKVVGKFQEVHYNAFTRPIDMASKASKLIADPKTNLPIRSHLNAIHGVGLTLPLANEERLFIRNISIVDENTDVGDSNIVLMQNDPNNLLDPDLHFKYVVGRRAYDTTGRLYNYTESTLKLLIELSHIQLLNHINIRPVSHTALFVKTIDYLNESNELVSLDITNLGLDSNLDILIEPIRTNKLMITLVAYAPVEIGNIQTGDLRKDILNKLLDGAGWNLRVDNHNEIIQARVYDFSLEAIAIRLRSYEQSGYFISKPIKVEKPLSFSTTVDTETIKINSVHQDYNTTYFLPENTVLHETYTELALHDRFRQRQLHCTIPIPSKKLSQTELIPLMADIGLPSFVPDIFFSSFKRRIRSATYAGQYVFTELEQEHGITEGIIYTDLIEVFFGMQYPNRNFFSIQWEAVSPTMLAFKRNDSILEFGLISENITPKGVVLRTLGSSPFSVHAEEYELELGKDYVYSLDNGQSWLGELISLRDFASLREVLFAGCFQIKVLDPDYDKYYWCAYKRAATQYLSPNKLFLLKDNTIIFDKSLRELSGTLQTMVILRSDSRMPYLSSVIHNYKLKVREI